MMAKDDEQKEYMKKGLGHVREYRAAQQNMPEIESKSTINE